MKKIVLHCLVFLTLCAVVNAQIATTSGNLQGFSAEATRRQRELETRFDGLLKRENMREWMRRLSARPHHVGSAYGKENAEFMLQLFKSWGYEAELERFDVLFPTPKLRLLEMTAPEKFIAKIEEPSVPSDPTSAQKDEQLPTYNAYSADGDAEGGLIYVNYGVPADYEELERRGISVKGKIVIARYGGSWRGIKPKVAAEKGAIGCLIYSDPRDDGYAQGEVYPNGAYRNENGVQRGSVADMPTFPGDPLTPFTGSTENAKRLKLKDAPTITKIPVMPISYADALPLLKNIGGEKVVPASWRGALPVTYKFGDGSAKVRLKLEFNWDTKPVYNVIAKLVGSEFPEQWIIRGNHHDAWVNGADDPLSGLVAELEEARVVGELAKKGFRPKRTIIYAAWDGEEPGLIGSTEWVETHADELRQKAVVYINSDSNGRGFLGMGGSHSLEKFINSVARDVKDPQTAVSVWERERARRIINGSPAEKRDVRIRTDLRIAALGSGSDYTPFLQHLGIAALNLGYGGEDGGGSYHSIYDSFTHFTRFVDPDFAYGEALAKTAGRAALRMANADVLPFEFTNFAETVERYASEVESLTAQMREETAQLNKSLADGTLRVVLDPTEKFILPKPLPEVPALDFKPLREAVEKLKVSAKNFEKARQEKPPNAEQAASLNEKLMQMERLLTKKEGLPRRAWFRHQIYAPGLYTGYGVKTLPAIREAVEQRNYAEAVVAIKSVTELLNAFADELDKSTNTLNDGKTSQ